MCQTSTKNVWWDHDEFEECVARSIIAQYETSPHKKYHGRTMPAQLRTNFEKAIKTLRSVGTYFAPEDRLIPSIELDDDIKECPPAVASFASIDPPIGDELEHYIKIAIAKRVPSLPQGWRSEGPAAIFYELLNYSFLLII